MTYCNPVRPGSQEVSGVLNPAWGADGMVRGGVEGGGVVVPQSVSGLPGCGCYIPPQLSFVCGVFAPQR